ncbi:probable ERG28 Protein involved in synthesis of ergosterol [Phialocephala subalpina]|uniref:Probable ERG28 Protein involved in synthesis of ergosterol n=1 Tax=Phialocephala subalpina TaxID=576137 RepID=A0A1L7XCI8_9HELO|nr:probable ERG28 Protein involved in synthesis of ergosterol [Phialocephala subalpina]
MASLVSTLTSYLPQHPGLLPQWLLLVSIVSIANSVQAYTTLSFTSRVYAGPSPSASKPKPPSANLMHPSAPHSPATPLSSRTFGTWTAIQSMVRLYAAYNISDANMYQMAFLTYVVAWLHFMSEWLVFGTARWGQGLAGPVFVANGTLVWMWVQWGFYVSS